MFKEGIEKKVFKFVAEAVEGENLKEIADSLNLVNQDGKKQLVFMSNPVLLKSGEVGVIIQTREFISGFRRD